MDGWGRQVVPAATSRVWWEEHMTGFQIGGLSGGQRALHVLRAAEGDPAVTEGACLNLGMSATLS
jgi:hypothetical protein